MYICTGLKIETAPLSKAAFAAGMFFVLVSFCHRCRKVDYDSAKSHSLFHSRRAV